MAIMIEEARSCGRDVHKRRILMAGMMKISTINALKILHMRLGGKA
jgi:hypothetical protein